MNKFIVFFTLLCFIFIFTACQKDDTVNTNKFEEALTEHKILFTTEELEEESRFIPGKRVLVNIDGERVFVHQLSSIRKAEEYTSKFDIGGCTIGNNHISWAGYPHFYQKWNLIIEYVGESDETVEILESILGAEFSGYYAAGNKRH